MSRWLRAMVATLCLAALTAPLTAQPTQKKVLTIYSMRRETELPVLADRELPRLLKATAGAVDFYSEYIDVPRFPEPGYQDGFREYLQLKYGGRHIDLVIAVQDVATQFVAASRDQLFPNTPVVFAATNPPRLANSTGVRVAVDLGKTVDFALSLQPDLRQLFIVTGASARDKVYEDLARAQLEPFAGRLQSTYLSNLSADDLEQTVATLPEHSAIYYLLFYQDINGENVEPLNFLDRIASVANRPIYSWTDTTFGHGVVGGAMRSAQSQVESIAAPAARILKGAAAGSIPVSTPNLYRNEVDARQLQRWELSDARLPQETAVLFKEPSLWERYWAYLIGAALVLVIQALLIAALLVNRAQRRRAEQRLRASETALRASYERVRDVGSRLLSAQDSERTRIARELHDDLGQQIAVLTFDVELLRGRRGVAGEVERISGDAVERLQEMGRTVHNIAHRLHPSRLRLLGLQRALSAMAQEMDSSALEVTFEHNSLPDVISHDRSLHMYRVAQESVQNAVKHSHARTLAMTLNYDAGRLTLTVIDDGVGFDAAAARAARGLGLISMRERLDSVGGSLSIESRLGAGTRVVATMPCGTDGLRDTDAFQQHA